MRQGNTARRITKSRGSSTATPLNSAHFIVPLQQAFWFPLTARTLGKRPWFLPKQSNM